MAKAKHRGFLIESHAACLREVVLDPMIARYAYRAKSIKNKPRINEDPKALGDGGGMLIRELRAVQGLGP